MCIKKKIAEIQQQIDSKLRLKSLLEKTQPLLTSISVLCADYREVAPEELPFLMEEILQAACISSSVAAVSAIAATGNEKAQDFAVDAMTQAIEQRASMAFQVQVQEHKSPPEPEYEPLECTDTLKGILGSRGFYEPGVNLMDVYSLQDKEDSYLGWDIYCSIHDSGQVMGIALSNENQFWDVGTEYLIDHDLTFPKSLADRLPILAWVRSVIDLLPTGNVLESSEVPGQLSLFDEKLTDEEYDAAVEEELALDDDIPELGGNWPEDVEELSLDDDAPLTDNQKEQSSDLIKKFLITDLPLPHQEMRVRVTPATSEGKFAGATFTFYRGTEEFEELFSSSQTAEQIARGENNPELIAVSLAAGWQRRQELRNVSPAGTTHTEPRVKDDFTELVYLSSSVAYLKRRDTGEILTAYLGFSNKTPEGDRASTMAKSRAIKWQEHLVEVYQLACSGPRECQRIESQNPKQPFKYELKLSKPSMGQLQKLSEENFSLYPNEIEEKQEESKFEFVEIPNFDLINPEYQVLYKGVELTNVWNSLRAKAGLGQQAQRLWRHRLLKPGEEIELTTREAAAFHALQRTRGLA